MVQYNIVRSKGKTPLAMSILAWGNEIILSSSQKGQQSFSYDGPDTPVKRSLQLSQATWVRESRTSADVLHRREGKCGEGMAAHLYYLFNDQPLSSRDAVIGTWAANNKDEDPKRADPCGDDPAKVSEASPFMFQFPVG
jgi:hypothetical protein